MVDEAHYILGTLEQPRVAITLRGNYYFSNGIAYTCLTYGQRTIGKQYNRDIVEKNVAPYQANLSHLLGTNWEMPSEEHSTKLVDAQICSVLMAQASDRESVETEVELVWKPTIRENCTTSSFFHNISKLWQTLGCFLFRYLDFLFVICSNIFPSKWQ